MGSGLHIAPGLHIAYGLCDGSFTALSTFGLVVLAGTGRGLTQEGMFGAGWLPYLPRRCLRH